MSHNTKPLKVVAVASGKGGVGKTNVSVNLSVGLARLGREVMLFDADLGLANVDVLLGLRPQRTLHDLVTGDVEDLEDVIIEGPEGIRVVPSASGIATMANLSRPEHHGLIQAFSMYTRPLDVLVVDTAAGLQESVTSFCQAVQETLVVVTDEPASMTDAYALIKVLHRDHGVNRFRVVANMVQGRAGAERVMQKLQAVCSTYLPEVILDLVGVIPLDDALRQAVQKRAPVVQQSPGSPAGRAFLELARKVDGWPVARGASGGVGFFVERMLQSA
ncbi:MULTISPECIES: MinD/ParA family protein [Thioalkalivibrio]|uniref:Cobyrinic acid a,c-diamide synthase n=1 Tax=Thioalkalivibrio halophilus TaxID=252474 RepID=A0A1V3A1Z5_9GAMM|nr:MULTISPECIES: MinD/ParA family protein [Thioalkalivibrio]OOC11356.1 cobyrinic acid a,c-diamide synthase [Thioalkalivibrio halophilus]PYG04067.1 flagellar biosynthesis protein FlhG [Thioalkalivibrio sp. ALE21]